MSHLTWLQGDSCFVAAAFGWRKVVLREACASYSSSLREIPHHLMKAKIHYRVHKNIQVDSILSQINPFHYQLMLWPVLCSTPKHFMRHLTFGFFERNCVNLRNYYPCAVLRVPVTPNLINLIIIGTKSVNYDESAIVVSNRLLLLAYIYRDKWRHIYYYVYNEIHDVTILLRIYRDKWLQLTTACHRDKWLQFTTAYLQR